LLSYVSCLLLQCAACTFDQSVGINPICHPKSLPLNNDDFITLYSSSCLQSLAKRFKIYINSLSSQILKHMNSHSYCISSKYYILFNLVSLNNIFAFTRNGLMRCQTSSQCNLSMCLHCGYITSGIRL
jgi:hypothetical protein